MKSLITLALIAGTLASPVISFAQSSNAPVTRAEVRADLVRIEQAGYRPSGEDPHYPEDIQAAEAKVGAQQVASVDSNAVGGVVMHASAQSGSRSSTPSPLGVYFGQ